MSANLLAAETSPYLLQHKNNPVHWQPWGPEALAEAARENKPILLSVGYAACHWCHVMAHESFEDPAIAALMNDLFVNIKVDREERPDVDNIYQSALALLGQQGGWPLTMFLTPEGHPFWGGTYFPPTARWGRPGFDDMLRAVAETYHREPDKVEQNVTALGDALHRLARPAPGADLTLATIDEAAGTAIRLVDPVKGGTQGAPKFPQPTFFRFLWHAYRRNRNPAFRQAVTVTLDQLCNGGIYDHVGGGFSRYSTDVDWLVPHFEKMLYDNALLIDLLSDVWQDTGSRLYATRVRETIAWALADMRSADDGPFAFVSAFDADSEGVEGKFYVWSEDEIDDLLGADAAPFKRLYDVTADGNWEGHTILNRSKAPDALAPAEEAAMRIYLDTLRAARSRRVPPQRDDKVLADWNGLMIAALVKAATTFDEPSWLDTAREVFDFVCDRMTVDGRLRHVWCAGSARHPAVVDDYANMARAAVALYEATGERPFLERAEAWVAVADAHYWDDAEGGYFLSAADTTDVISRAKTLLDNATPSGNTVMVEVLARLHHLTGAPRYRSRCEAIARLVSGSGPQQLIAATGLLTGYEFLERARQVVVVGDRTDPRTAALAKAAATAPEPLTVMTLLAPGEPLPDAHPAAGKGPVNGAPAAYVCQGPTCGLPVTEGEALHQLLAS